MAVHNENNAELVKIEDSPSSPVRPAISLGASLNLNGEAKAQPPIMRLPTEILAKIIDLCISNMILPSELVRPTSQYPPNNLTGIIRVCRRLHGICVDVLSREKTVYLSLNCVRSARGNHGHPSKCIGGPSQCFHVSHELQPGSKHMAAHVFDRFSSIKIMVFRRFNRSIKVLVPCLEALVDFIKSSARLGRGVTPLASLEIDFQLRKDAQFYRGEIPVQKVLQKVKTTLQPFRSLRNVRNVQLTSNLTKGASNRKIWTWEEGEAQWCEVLRHDEVKLFRKARKEMMN